MAQTNAISRIKRVIINYKKLPKATATLTKRRFMSGEVLGEGSVAPRQNHCCGDG